MHKTQIDARHLNSYLIYTRKSTDDANNQKNSIDYQVSEGLQYSMQNKLLIADITVPGFCDSGIIKERHSGFKQDRNFEILENSQISQKVERPKFLMLVSLLQKKSVKGIICLCWDRISRNENDDVLIKKLINAGIEFKFVQVTYDSTSSGALHMDIDGMFSRHYSRVISEKVTNATRKLRSQGKCTYRAPVGYLNQGSDNKILDPQSAPMVKKMFELYATGEWGLVSLTHWAKQQGLVCQPRRRNRSVQEQLSDIDMANIPKSTRPLSKRSVEHILKNEFYIGKVKDRDVFIKGIHQPLIDTSLFFKVQSVIQQKNVTKHKPHKDFFTYRGLIQCEYCHRFYSPYEQKGINYMMLKCKPDCKNTRLNIAESIINSEIQNILKQLHFTDQEFKDLENDEYNQLDKVTDKRNRELNEIFIRLNKANQDLEYLCKEKISFIRNNIMSMEEIRAEETRLNIEIENYQSKIASSSDSSEKMLNYILLFSELIKNVSLYFAQALDSEKADIINLIFSELYFSNNGLKYKAKQGFSALFERNTAETVPYGAAYYLFSELENIYPFIKENVEALKIFNRN